MKVLLVENHATFARIVVETFLADHDVDVVPSLSAAREALGKAIYDLLLLDYDLDDGKGDALLRDLPAPPHRPRVVGISARPRGNEALLAAGADAICAKTDFGRSLGDVIHQPAAAAPRGSAAAAPRGSATAAPRAPATGAFGTPAASLLDRIKGALLGTLLGDALGAPLEGASPGRELDELVQRRLDSREPLGLTDDGEMMLGVLHWTLAAAEDAKSISELDARLAAEGLMEVFAASFDAARGYGKGTRRAIEAFAAGASLYEAARSCWSEGSRGNGAAVRVAPLACIAPGAERRDQLVERAATTTHAHPDAVTAAKLAASTVAWALEAEPGAAAAEDRGEQLLRHLAGLGGSERLVEPLLERLHRGDAPSAVAAHVGTSPLALESVPTAIYAFARHGEGAQGALQGALCLGGDTDSIGALVGAFAGAYYGVSGFPPTWLARLDNGPRGRDAVLGAARRLLSARRLPRR